MYLKEKTQCNSSNIPKYNYTKLNYNIRTKLLGNDLQSNMNTNK